MKFKEDRRSPGIFRCKSKGYNFTISKSYDTNNFYIVAISIKNDIRYNSLWEDKEFNEFDDAILFCETFNYKNHKCLGCDVDK